MIRVGTKSHFCECFQLPIVIIFPFDRRTIKHFVRLIRLPLAWQCVIASARIRISLLFTHTRPLALHGCASLCLDLRWHVSDEYVLQSFLFFSFSSFSFLFFPKNNAQITGIIDQLGLMILIISLIIQRKAFMYNNGNIIENSSLRLIRKKINV